MKNNYNEVATHLTAPLNSLSADKVGLYLTLREQKIDSVLSKMPEFSQTEPKPTLASLASDLNQRKINPIALKVLKQVTEDSYFEDGKNFKTVALGQSAKLSSDGFIDYINAKAMSVELPAMIKKDISFLESFEYSAARMRGDDSGILKQQDGKIVDMGARAEKVTVRKSQDLMDNIALIGSNINSFGNNSNPEIQKIGRQMGTFLASTMANPATQPVIAFASEMAEKSKTILKSQKQNTLG